jgi:hypothetical protein
MVTGNISLFVVIAFHVNLCLFSPPIKVLLEVRHCDGALLMKVLSHIFGSGEFTRSGNYRIILKIPYLYYFTIHRRWWGPILVLKL